MKTKAFMLVASGMTFLLANDATAQRFVVRNGSGWQQTSGVGGQSTRTMMPNYAAVLVGIEYGEIADHPCWLKLTWRYFGDDGQLHGPATNADSPDVYWDQTTCPSNFARDKHTVSVTTTPSMPRALRLVRVCSRNANNRVKGLRVRGANITPNGAVRDNGIKDEHKRFNCGGNWSPRVSQCPDGQAITGVRVESNPSGNRRDIVGIAVHCSRVRLGA